MAARDRLTGVRALLEGALPSADVVLGKTSPPPRPRRELKRWTIQKLARISGLAEQTVLNRLRDCHEARALLDLPDGSCSVPDHVDEATVRRACEVMLENTCVPKARWSEKHSLDACVRCHRDDRRHAARGLCTACNAADRRRAVGRKPVAFPGAWCTTTGADRCSVCWAGKAQGKRHNNDGRCWACQRWWVKNKLDELSTTRRAAACARRRRLLRKLGAKVGSSAPRFQP